MSISEDRQNNRSVIAGSSRGSVPVFFDDLGANLVKLMCCNVIFVLFNIPAMAIAFLYTAYMLPKMNASLMPVEFTDTLLSLGIHGMTNRSNDITGEDVSEYERR